MTPPLKRELVLAADHLFVYYRGVPLVNNGYYKKLMTRGYLVRDVSDTPSAEESEHFYILLETPNCYDSQDLHTYGEWETLAEAEAWLENPVPLY
jgi:hypothetical protein